VADSTPNAILLELAETWELTADHFQAIILEAVAEDSYADLKWIEKVRDTHRQLARHLRSVVTA